jgi:hypothetical protein
MRWPTASMTCEPYRAGVTNDLCSWLRPRDIITTVPLCNHRVRWSDRARGDLTPQASRPSAAQEIVVKSVFNAAIAFVESTMRLD